MGELLAVRDLDVRYGAIRALRGLTLHVDEGEIVALIGANGAGKSTLMGAIVNQLPWESGSVLFRGEELRALKTSEIVRRGLALVPEGRKVFPRSSVEDNLLLGAWTVRKRFPAAEGLARAYESFPRLRERRKQAAGTLSGGEQQMLAVARALMSRPRLLLLDEPSMGLSPLAADRLFETIEGIRQGGVTVLLVEQNANRALQLASRGYCLEAGSVILEGSAAELRENCRVKEAYLGG